MTSENLKSYIRVGCCNIVIILQSFKRPAQVVLDMAKYVIIKNKMTV
jgi:hypothetical protein